MPTLPACGCHDLRDREWRVLEPLLPRGKKPGRPRKWAKRQLIDGIRWRVRTGAPWRGMPPRYGPWQSVYGLLRRWQHAGTWAAVVTALRARPEVLGQLAGEPELGQLLARALIYRLITEVVMRAGTPGIEAAARAAAPVTDLVTAYCCA